MWPHAVQVERVWDAAVGSALDRRTTFVALGGGVVGDMTGFAAAAYQRGVHFLQVQHRPCLYAHPVPTLTVSPPAHDVSTSRLQGLQLFRCTRLYQL